MSRQAVLYRDALSERAEALAALGVPQLFADNPDRALQLSRAAAGIHLDFSKQLIDASALTELVDLADACSLPERFRDLVGGAACNSTESRPALHTLLRGTGAQQLAPLYSEVGACLERMRELVFAVHSGERRGHSGALFTDVVNIGIGGSDLGPRMVCRATAGVHSRLRSHFVANVDPQDLDEVLADLHPATTLVVVCSKSFTTEETLANALRARHWLIGGGVPEAEIHRHVLAVTTNIAAAEAFGIGAGQCFPLWDWVGGRYSVWSAVGLIIALQDGWDAFTELLGGAAAMDEHSLSAPSARNLPLLLALLELWNTLYLGCESHLVLPYSQRLEALPALLQQLTMESNGKRVCATGETLDVPCAPVLWGSAGTIGQHSYYQLLHQGNRGFAADIVLPLRNGDVHPDSHRKLAANALAQSRALMIGRTAEEARALARERNQPESMAPHYEMPGSRPHSLIWFDSVSHETLGALLAAYEHKTFFLSCLLDINAFDQWGVELGKVIGRQVDTALDTGAELEALDPSTAALAQAWRDANHTKALDEHHHDGQENSKC